MYVRMNMITQREYRTIVSLQREEQEVVDRVKKVTDKTTVSRCARLLCRRWFESRRGQSRGVALTDSAAALSLTDVVRQYGGQEVARRRCEGDAGRPIQGHGRHQAAAADAAEAYQRCARH